MSFSQLFILALGAILVENFVLTKFLGVCPFLGVSKRMDTAIGMGFIVTFVMTASAVVIFFVNAVLLRANLEALRIAVFVLVVAAVVQLVDLILQKMASALHASLSIYLPLATANCAILGVVLLSTAQDLNFIATVVYAFAAGLGFLLAITLFAGVRERLDFSDYPKAFEGVPIALITAGLLSMAFMGFAGMRF
ncbi:MAG: RnfABCDGE type electron transport complex subunit A [Oscillospiraceae bacterium]|nr:RnfABCDGE type electron transport complex subunit A [Oscillospiraceae bacterium]